MPIYRDFSTFSNVVRAQEFPFGHFEQSKGIQIEVTIDSGPNQKTVGFPITVEEIEKHAGTTFLDQQLCKPIDITKACMGLQNAGVIHRTGNERLFLFRNRIYQVTGRAQSSDPTEEAILTVMRFSYLQDRRLMRLRSEVEALEKLQGESPRNNREPIPDCVKMLVYERDGGKCVKCGSTQKLHFDHVIPVSKGGDNTEENVQLLCEYCNLQKGSNLF